MAKVERLTATVVSTGNKIYSLSDYTLNPEYIAISVVSNNGTERSVGASNGIINFSGNSGVYTDSSSTKAVSHYKTVGGVKTKVLEGTVTSFSSGDIYMNFTTCTENTQISMTVYGS